MRDARDRQYARHPGQHDHAGDDGGRRQHDADLEGGRGDFVVVVFCGGVVALVFGVLGALGEFFRTFAGFRLRTVTRRGLVPVVDLLLQAPLSRHRRRSVPRLSLACSAVACTTVRRMLLAWKNAHRFEASTFLLMASVCAPLPSVSDNARNKAITAISNAIFLFEPEACSACSACSMLSCAPIDSPPAD